MLLRRVQYDDSRGVGEPLNETGLDGLGIVVRGLHFVAVDSAFSTLRRLAARSLFKPQGMWATAYIRIKCIYVVCINTYFMYIGILCIYTTNRNISDNDAAYYIYIYICVCVCVCVICYFCHINILAMLLI